MENAIHSAMLLCIPGGGVVSMLLATWRVNSEKWFLQRGPTQAILWTVAHLWVSFYGVNDLFKAMKMQGTMGNWAYAFLFVVPLLALVIRLLYWVEKATAK